MVFALVVNAITLYLLPRLLSIRVPPCLKDLNVEHWLEGGSLLGAVRENGNLLAWEDDVDISFLLDDKTTWPTITKALSERCN